MNGPLLQVLPCMRSVHVTLNALAAIHRPGNGMQRHGLFLPFPVNTFGWAFTGTGTLRMTCTFRWSPPTQRYIPSAVNGTLLHGLPFMRHVHVPHASPVYENPPNICYSISVCFCLWPISNNNNNACPCRWMGGYSPERAPRHEWKWYRTATYTSKYTLKTKFKKITYEVKIS